MGFNKSALVAILLISIAFGAISILILDLGTNYSVTISQDYQSSFDKFNEAKLIAEENSGILDNGTIDTSGGITEAVYKSAIVAGKQSRASGSLLINLLSESQKILNIPSVLIITLGILFLTLSAFAFAKIITKEDP